MCKQVYTLLFSVFVHFAMMAQTNVTIADFQPYIPSSYTPNTSCTIGDIYYIQKVNHNGAVTINIPIDLPQTPNSFYPSVSICYNSSQEEGLLGYGWGIAYNSIISKSKHTYYYDGVTKDDSMPLTSSAYYLDGQRLIRVDSCDTHIEYRCETGNNKVYAYYSGVNIINFKVFSPNGTQQTYSINDGIDFYLTKSSDVLGNEIEYIYDTTYKPYNPTLIRYGKNKEAFVSFNYTERNNNYPIFYNHGSIYQNKLILNNISTFVNDSLFRSYYINYQTLNGSYLINNISCKVSDSDSINPLKFYYNDIRNDYSLQSQEYNNIDNNIVVNPNYQVIKKGKFEHETEVDAFLCYENKITYKKSGSKIINEYDSVYGYYDNICVTSLPAIGNEAYSSTSDIFTEKGFIDCICADVDDTPGDEILVINNSFDNGFENLNFRVYKTARNTSTPQINSLSVTQKYNYSLKLPSIATYDADTFAIPKKFLQGDFNGDGLEEILAISSNNTLGLGNTSTCYLFDIKNNKKIYEGSPFAFNMVFPQNADKVDDADRESDKLYVIDYDGDSKSDICHINNVGLSIYTFDIQDTTIECRHISTYDEITNAIFSTNNDRKFLIGEFNGDSKTDFLLSATNNAPTNEKNKWIKYLSKGNGTWDNSFYSIIFDYDNNAQYFLQDMNNDGISDVIRNHLKDNKTYIGVWLMNTPMQSTSSIANLYETECSNGLYFIPSNIYNKHFSNHILGTINSKTKRFYLENDNYNPRLLTGVISSNGLIHKYSYKRLNNYTHSDFYLKSNNVRFPYFSYNGNLEICDRSITLINNNTLNDIHYKYYNAIGHKQGLGFIGFEKFAIYNNTRSDSCKICYIDTCHLRAPIYIETPREIFDYKYNITISPNRLATINVSEKSQYDKAHNSIDIATFEYDLYGNITSEKHILEYEPEYNHPNTECSYRTITSYKNIINDSIYLLGLPLVTTKTTNNGFIDVKRTTYTYNNYGQTLTKTYANMPSSYASDISRAAPPTSSDNIINKETYIYDNNHRLTKKTLKKYTSTNTLDENYTYYSNGSLKTKTDAIGLTERYVYDVRGRLIELYDNNDNVTTFNYDKWDRKIKTVYPNMPSMPTIVNYKFADTSDNVPGALKKVITIGKSDSIIYFNALGRKIRKTEKHFDNKNIHKDWQYDTFGRVTKESYPYDSDINKKWITYEYDNFNRITETLYPGGGKDSITYYNNVVISRIDNVYKKTEKNPLGQTLFIDSYNEETNDDYGIVWFKYRADGQYNSIECDNGYTINYTYDALGRCTMVSDPAIGTKTHTYNNAGDIETETDGNYITTHYTYDKFGRIIDKLTNMGSISYTYNNSGNILKKSYGGTRGIIYDYDIFGRTKYEKETGYDGSTISREYNYDPNYGYLKTTIDTINGTKIIVKEYVYDTEGKYLKKIKVGNNVIWEINKINAFGEVTEETTGGLKHIYLYDCDGNPTAYQTKKKNKLTGDSLFIKNHLYNFSNTTKNLLSRTDVTRNLIENFTYDNYGRLTSYDNKDIEYNYSGNIISLDQVGTFEYTSSNPYALTSLTPNGNRIPNTMQSITYNTNNRVATIQEGSNYATFDYTADGKRTRMILKKNSTTILNRQYFTSNDYERDITPNGTEERLYLDGDAYSANSVMTRSNGGEWVIKYICRDYLGSITHITDSVGNILQELSYDAWGNLREPSTHTLYTANDQPSLLLGRGYTGHEHLPQFGLINMNARLYDPVTTHFLNPDPYIQTDMGMQAFNRYSYCLNNPLKYSDESGEFFSFFRELLANTIIRPWTEGINAWTDSDNWHATKNSLKIASGLLAGKFGQTLKRLTWELPQTSLGYTFAAILNNIGMVKNVEQFRGATVTSSYESSIGLGQAITLGSFITGNNELKAEINNYLFMHEYGHYLQSQNAGLFYLINYGLPSIIPYKEHDDKGVEQDANARAIKFFNNLTNKINENEDNNKITLYWDFEYNPVKDYNKIDDVIKSYNYNNWLQSIFPF